MTENHGFLNRGGTRIEIGVSGQFIRGGTVACFHGMRCASTNACQLARVDLDRRSDDPSNMIGIIAMRRVQGRDLDTVFSSFSNPCIHRSEFMRENIFFSKTMGG